MQAPIRRIIPQSTVDGPGNRVAIFLQGCNLRCTYCHNPETRHCPQPNHPGPWQWMTVSQVMDEIQRAMPFVRGVTLSGGECMLYPRFAEDLFRACRPLGLTCLIDNNGTIPFRSFPSLLQVTDGVMLDVKSWSPDIFRRLTGGEPDTVRDNLLFLCQQGKLEEVRIVCLPGEVDVERTLQGIADTVGPGPHPFRLRLIPFRPQGVEGRLADHPSPTDQQMDIYRALASRLSLIP